MSADSRARRSIRVRAFACAVAATLACAGVAGAQPPSSGGADRGYAEVVLQSAFGNVTSQNFGAEIGVTVVSHLQVFAEAGKTRDVSTKALSAAAQTMAGALASVQSNVDFSVKEPVIFGAIGARYVIPIQGSKLQPYVLGGVGIAKVTQDVKFLVGGTDVTNNMQQFGIVLGTDVLGEFTKPLIVFGGGVSYPIWQRLALDFQFRYGRILADDEAIPVGRVGLGVGVRF